MESGGDEGEGRGSSDGGEEGTVVYSYNVHVLYIGHLLSHSSVSLVHVMTLSGWPLLRVALARWMYSSRYWGRLRNLETTRSGRIHKSQRMHCTCAIELQCFVIMYMYMYMYSYRVLQAYSMYRYMHNVYLYIHISTASTRTIFNIYFTCSTPIA